MPKGSSVITEGPHGKGLCGKSLRHSLIQSGLSSWALSAAQKQVLGSQPCTWWAQEKSHRTPTRGTLER